MKKLECDLFSGNQLSNIPNSLENRLFRVYVGNDVIVPEPESQAYTIMDPILFIRSFRERVKSAWG